MKKMGYGGFLVRYGLMTALLALPVIANLIFITRAYENTRLDRLVRIQKEIDGIYGTALNQNTFGYKLEMARLVRPEVLALGSSRVMTLREEFFGRSFVNCGGAMNHLNEGRMFLEQLFPHHRPKVLILGLDFWWFSEELHQPDRYDYHDNDGSTITMEKLFKPYVFLVEGKLTVKEYAAILLTGKRRNDVTAYEGMGLRAIRGSDGFRRDGSILYGSLIFGRRGDIRRSVDFPVIRDPARAAGRRYEYGDTFSRKRAAELTAILDLCRRNGVKTVVVLPPVTERIFRWMEERPAQYRYVKDFERFVADLPEESYNFHDIRSIGSNDCECIDSIHIGDVGYQRLLLTTLHMRPDSVLRPFVKAPLMEESVRRFAGRVLAVFDDDRGMFPYRERSFLDITCAK